MMHVISSRNYLRCKQGNCNGKYTFLEIFLNDANVSYLREKSFDCSKEKSSPKLNITRFYAALFARYSEKGQIFHQNVLKIENFQTVNQVQIQMTTIAEKG